jgi:phosphotransferase system HPr (HPr) family protein
MNEVTLRRRVTITNPQGFHLRPQNAFAQKAKQFACTVTLIRDDLRVDGKRQWDLMMLSVEQGTELELEVSGADAAAALDALVEILEATSAD